MNVKFVSDYEKHMENIEKFIKLANTIKKKFNYKTSEEILEGLDEIYIYTNVEEETLVLHGAKKGAGKGGKKYGTKKLFILGVREKNKLDPIDYRDMAIICQLFSLSFTVVKKIQQIKSNEEKIVQYANFLKSPFEI